MNNHYDIIITGAGCAGLSLAHHLIESSSLNNKKVLLLDYASKDQNDRTWCFWTQKIPAYRSAQQKQWSHLLFRGEKQEKIDEIAPYQYVHIRGAQFYQEIFTEIEQAPSFIFQRAKVDAIRPDETRVLVETSKATYTADYVFNSISGLNIHRKSNDITTKQHFLGYVIETEKEVFDEAQATLMDFRVDQKGQSRFFYVLPFSKSKALIEFTVFSDEVLIHQEYKQVISTYLEENLGLESYRILEEERGAIPMSNTQLDNHPHPRVFHLGMAGGMTKPTTGYTFRNIQ